MLLIFVHDVISVCHCIDTLSLHRSRGYLRGTHTPLFFVSCRDVRMPRCLRRRCSLAGLLEGKGREKGRGKGGTGGGRGGGRPPPSEASRSATPSPLHAPIVCKAAHLHEARAVILHFRVFPHAGNA
jgi:hypothetical protein